MVTPGSRVADVGCDHGFVSIYLYRQGISPRVYAMDVRPGPLSRAKEHIEAYGLSSYIETRLSDGVEALAAGEADTLICAGMGGRLMAKILSDGMEKIRDMRELILQPQSELAFFRKFLRTHDFCIMQENMVKEDGKYYPMMRAVPVERIRGLTENDMMATGASKDGGTDCEAQARQRREDLFGPCLLRERNPVLEEYLRGLLERNDRILSGLQTECNQTRRSELLLEQEDIKQCLACFATQEGAVL